MSDYPYNPVPDSVLNRKLDLILSILQESKMATFAEELASLQTAFTAAQDRVTTDLANLDTQVTTLQGQITALQAQLANAGLTPDQLTALQVVVDGINNLDVPVTPTPPPVQAPVMKASKPESGRKI